MLSCPELLSPAGSLEALKYAVMYGADAVYCAPLASFMMAAFLPMLAAKKYT